MFNFLRNDYHFGIFWLALILIIFFLPVIIGSQSLIEAIPTAYDGYSLIPPQLKTPWTIDGATHTRATIPMVTRGIQLLKEGVPPLWMSYSGGAGEVLAGNTGSGLYYPLRLLFFIIFQNIHAFDWYIILRFFIAGFGMFLFLKEINLSRQTSLFGAISYMFSGYFIIYITYTFLDIDAILPYIFWSIEKYFKNRSWPMVAMTGFFIGLTILGQQPQTTIIVGLFYSGYFLWKIFLDKEQRQNWPTHLFFFMIMIIIGILIGLPFLADIFINYKQGVTINDLNNRGQDHFSSWFYLLHFLIPPATILETAIGGHLYDRSFTEIIPFFGINIIICAIASIFLKNKKRIIYFFYAFIIFAILKNWGIWFFDWFGTLPILNLIGWHKIYGPMGFSLSVLAAYTIQLIPHSQWQKKAFLWSIVSIPALFIIAYTSSPTSFLKTYVPRFDFLNRRPETIQSFFNFFETLPDFLEKWLFNFIENGGIYITLSIFLITSLFSILGIVCLLMLSKNKKKALLFLIFLITFEFWLSMPKLRDGFRYFNPYEKTPPYIEFLQARKKIDGVQRVFATDYTFMSYLGEVYEIQRSQTFSSIKPKRYLQLLPKQMLNNDFFNLWSNQFQEIPNLFFDVSNIKYIISQKSLPEKKEFTLIYNQDVKIYENKTVLPKAYIVFQNTNATSVLAAREKLYSETFDHHKSVILENTKLILPSTTEKAIAAKINSYKTNKIELETNTTKDGILVLSETFYPGWQAFIDDKRTSILPANILFRGIFLPAGNHKIIFSFNPPWFWPTITISLIMMIISITFILYEPLSQYYRRRQKR